MSLRIRNHPDLALRDPLVVLGIDPGSLVMGFGVVGRRQGRLFEVDHGAFRAPRRAPLEARLLHMSERVAALLDHHLPDVIALEEAFMRKNVQSALRIGEARSVVLVAGTARGIPVFQYPTAVAKKSVCGHGRAAKADVQEMVTRHLGLDAPPRPHDASDALALALCLLFDPRLDPRVATALGMP